MVALCYTLWLQAGRIHSRCSTHQQTDEYTVWIINPSIREYPRPRLNHQKSEGLQGALGSSGQSYYSCKHPWYCWVCSLNMRHLVRKIDSYHTLSWQKPDIRCLSTEFMDVGARTDPESNTGTAFLLGCCWAVQVEWEGIRKVYWWAVDSASILGSTGMYYYHCFYKLINCLFTRYRPHSQRVQNHFASSCMPIKLGCLHSALLKDILLWLVVQIWELKYAMAMV